MSHSMAQTALPEQSPKYVDARFVWQRTRIGTTLQGLPLYECRSLFGVSQGPCVLAQDLRRVAPAAVRTGLFGQLHVE